MNRGIGGVVELLRHPGVWRIFTNSSALAMAPFMPFARGEDEFRAEHGQQRAAFQAHRFGHGEDELVARAAATKARAMPVLPLVGSTMIVFSD